MIPSAIYIRKRLRRLTPAQLHRLSALSGVPVRTLRNVREGTTGNPGVETVRAFMPHISAAKGEA